VIARSSERRQSTLFEIVDWKDSEAGLLGRVAHGIRGWNRSNVSKLSGERSGEELLMMIPNLAEV
jgi:hypothetical protein